MTFEEHLLVSSRRRDGYYYHDASGSTSHLADSAGHLLEWYRFDLQGKPVFYNSSNVQITDSNYGIRHLFTGQQWYSELGLYDLRNRFYSPDIGRFLQPDPIGFNGDPTNLYRYCGNNPLKWSDPSGLGTGTNPTYEDGRGYSPLEESERVIVTGEFLDFNNYYNDALATSELNTFGSLGGEGSLLRFLPREQRDFNIGDRLPPSPPLPPHIPPPLPSQSPSFNQQPFTLGPPPSDPNQPQQPSNWTNSVVQWAQDHLSLDLNINSPVVGGNLGVNSTGVYGNGGIPGPGGIGEATMTVNVNFGSVPRGQSWVISGAVGNLYPPFFPAGRLSFGYSDTGGWFFNGGLGLGPAAYFGVTPLGGGGYIYRWDH